MYIVNFTQECLLHVVFAVTENFILVKFIFGLISFTDEGLLLQNWLQEILALFAFPFGLLNFLITNDVVYYLVIKLFYCQAVAYTIKILYDKHPQTLQA